MRILALTNLYPNPLQPHRAPFNRNQLRMLAKQHEVRVIAPIAWTDEWSARRCGDAALPSGRRHIFDNLLVEHPRYYFPPGILRGWYGRCYRWSVRRAFNEALEQFRPDVVYAPWAYPDGWAAVELGHEAGLPVVIKVHGSDVLLLSRTPGRRRGTVDALQRADHIVAVSQDLADRMVDLGIDSEKIEVVYDGLDLEVFRPGPKAEARARLGLNAGEPMALFVGNLLALKGVEVLLQACARLRTEGLRFTCRLFGQGPMRTRLEQTIRTKKLEDCVHLHGCLSNEQLPDWYRAADVFVLPSYSEGVPNVLLEAAACGTPFIASRVGGIPEIAALGVSRLVPAGDAVQLAEALGDFLKGVLPPRAADAPSVRSRAEAIAQLSRLLEETTEQHGSIRPSRQTVAAY
jgi:glycosyltransferase involved in cell wall biosynthesis